MVVVVDKWSLFRGCHLLRFDCTFFTFSSLAYTFSDFLNTFSAFKILSHFSQRSVFVLLYCLAIVNCFDNLNFWTSEYLTKTFWRQMSCLGDNDESSVSKCCHKRVETFKKYFRRTCVPKKYNWKSWICVSKIYYWK